MDLIYSTSLVICLLSSAIFFILMFYASLIFWSEKENNAALKSIAIAVILPLPYLFSWIYNWEILALILSLDLLLTTILFFLPFPTSKNITEDFPNHQIDERNTMFSRNELEPGSDRYKDYYKQYPEKKILDDAFRKEAGLTSKRSIFYNTLAFAAANASFYTISQLGNAVEDTVHPEKQDISSKYMATFLQEWGKKLGAMEIGFTKLSDYHYYSHKGRGETYGKEITNHHKYAIAFTVEMTREMVTAAPQASIVMESGQQYLEAGRIAVQIAQFLRNLGYPARAHIDGNYQVVCPLVARDAGLGEIGRMGLLMTPRKGPRVRLGVITTDFEFPVHKWNKNHSLLDFCNRCKKCADVCPSKSISWNPPKEINGVKRWQINSESCFTYWCKAGTDCGRCMATCPYSHPDNLLHNSIRWGIKHSPLFRRIAVPLDDFFYGRKPKSAKMPKWILDKK
ncbi:4Fe-4S dicluster domain-containing protein [Ancylomarina longa]|uniref:4Fe-4S dicluster domain-containing protein n=1 Tax=Ancylomarina longa TaxID=2487017 RepID=A0A434AFD1_9BACT|nr:reductive dehalogenase domain-containing protein [Ancylomarina longa]RUT73084.1 4Fe-4S dicluster domain-containing protein [Ancylomarina longa]